MRKKSHISLVRYIMRNFEEENLNKHKKAFMLGSILPDCVPSFLTRKHNIEQTFPILEKEISKLTEKYDKDGINGYFCRHLGVITHYIADYFTYPHNSVFKGSLREHCSYEEELKKTFKEYVFSPVAARSRSKERTFCNVEEICAFIKERHEKYLAAIKEVKADCRAIAELCFSVVDAILQIFEIKVKERQLALA